ncbi:hypothetical protein [Pseudomonas sp. BIGb0164]|uniref:hypothetical protein n=1 Tax=Pseudomonas sp. BIGb0164 TaxID=2940605 RepID=UPI0021692549|nr:hypothetical protein [Pseudomonas sp. BIGb0164]MCS4250593.1 hypothetical protein [Pseudomonas sp. BIGb0164]
MSDNTANPAGPQYGSARRDTSPSGVTLPTHFLNYAWDLELAHIVKAPDAELVEYHVARSQGFAWGLRAADMINEDVLKAMTEAIAGAEQNAYTRIAQNDHESG